MAGYKRPFSKHELRQMRRKKQREIFWSALFIVLGVAAVAGVIYLIYQSQYPHH